MEATAAKKAALKKHLKRQLRGELSIADRNRYASQKEVLDRVGASDRDQFCTWQCVKAFINRKLPVQQRYNTCLLVDMIAGEIV
jgi:hypothetical protein